MRVVLDQLMCQELGFVSATYRRNMACRGDAGPNATLAKCVSVQAGCHDQMETVDCCQNSAGARCRELIMTRPKYKLLSTMKAVSHRRAEAHKQTQACMHTSAANIKIDI